MGQVKEWEITCYLTLTMRFQVSEALGSMRRGSHATNCLHLV